MRQIVLLRGINLGPKNRISMPALREILTEAGFENPRTYLQSGNVVLSSELSSEELAGRCRGIVQEALGLDLPVITRTRDELAETIDRNPLAEVADNPKRYQVTFLSEALGADRVGELTALASPTERLVAIGRELYAWHPEGVARSKLSMRLGAQSLGVNATARNWTTVTSLLAMADE